MKPKNGYSSKACWKARQYRRWMCSDIMKGKTPVKKRSHNLKTRWDHINRKPRSKRKRSSECWADRVHKEHRVSENIGTTEESCQVQRSETTSSGLQVLEVGERKLKLRIRLANPPVELEEGEIPPTPSPERLVANVDDCESPRTSQLMSEEHSKTCNETVQSMKETETPHTNSNGLCLSDKKHPVDMINYVCDASPDSASTGGTEILVDSDTDSDVVELVGQKCDTSTSNVKSREVTSKSTNVEESRHQNDQINDSVDDPATCSTQPVTIGVANLPESQEREAVTPIRSESHIRSSGTHTPVAPPVERVSIPCSQVYGLRSFHEPGSRTNLQGFGSMSYGSTSCVDPLQNEMEMLKKHHEQELKMHEAMMLQMKAKRDEMLKEYEILFQGSEAELQHKTVDFNAKFQKLYLTAASDNVNHLVPNPTQMSADRLDQCRPVVTPSTVAINQVPARPSNILYQNVYEYRAAVPQLGASSSQSFSPSLLFPVRNNGDYIQHFPRYSCNN